MSVKPVVSVFKIKPTAYIYNAKVVEVVDGDTVKLELKKDHILDVDFGFYIMDKIVFSKTARQTCRLKGINAPEMHGVTKEDGEKAKEALNTLLQSGAVVATICGQEKYGRWLADLSVTPPGTPTIGVSQWMIDHGYAVPYNA